MKRKRQTALNGALLYLRILDKLSVHSKMTADGILQALLADGLAVELRTVQRALKAIVESDFLPVECDSTSTPYGYRLKKTTNSLHLGSLSPHEALLLRLAQDQMRYQLPTRLMKSMNGLFTDALYHIQTHPGEPEAQWRNKVRVVPTSQTFLPASIHNSVFESISEALYEQRMIEVKYYNQERQNKTARVMPVALVQQGVRLYLVCQFEGYDNYRHLALHRIESVKLLFDTFIYPKDFNLTRYIEDGSFGFRTGRKVRVTLTLDQSLGDYFAETPISKDQILTWNDDRTEAIVVATMPETEMIHWFIEGQGKPFIIKSHIEVIEGEDN